MVPRTLAVALMLGLMTAAHAQDPASKATTETDPAASLKQNPDDQDALRKYVNERIGKIVEMLPADPDGAEKELAGMKSVLDSIAPEKAETRQILGQIKSAIPTFKEQIELARIPLTDLQQRLQKSPDDPKSLISYARKLGGEVMEVAASDPAKAKRRLAEGMDFLGKIRESAGADIKEGIDSLVRQFASMEKKIDADLSRDALVGKPAAPMEAEAWVNGSPLTDADLKGKVVLLDFWAVWCGPCIATFPHLREWNEKYADKGLVIVGLTRYYGYTWDEEKQRAQPAEGSEKPTPEQEQAMLVKFAEQHKLTHRFAIQGTDTLSDYYGVSGIPQVVVIDRKGTVRMIRVGSGDANAKAIGALLEELIGESPAAGD